MMLTTPQSSDFTAKLASNTDSAAEEASLKKTSSTQEEEEEEEEEEVEEEMEEEEEVEEEEEENSGKRRFIWVGRHRVPEYIEPEPEWDVDSHDGRKYESDPEDRKYFSNDEEYQEYRVRKRKIFDSKGFLPDVEKGIHNWGLDVPPSGSITNREYATNLALLCIEKLNEKKGKTVELDSIVRATESGGSRWKLRMTIMVREYPNGPLVEYQAKVLKYAGNIKPPFPIFCRPSPTPNLQL